MMTDSPTAEDGIYPNLSQANDSAPDPPLSADCRAELEQELTKVEEEIATLKQVLHSKEHHASELRKQLGLTPLGQLKAELNKVQNSQAYQSTQAKVSELNEKVTSSEYYKKTSETLKNAGNATASALNTIGSTVTSKFSEMKNSPTFKILEEKVEGVGTTIMAKVTGVSRDENDASHAGDAADQPVTHQPTTH